MDLSRFKQTPEERRKNKESLIEMLQEKVEIISHKLSEKRRTISVFAFIFISLISFVIFSLVTAGGFTGSAEAVLNLPNPPRLLANRNYERYCNGPGWRAPMSITLSSPNYPDIEGRRIDWNKVSGRINNTIAQKRGVRIGFVIKDLKTGRTLLRNENARFASASLVKIPLLITLYRDITDGKIKVLQGAYYSEKLRASGSGRLKSEPANRRINLRDLVFLMLQHSDNTATNILADLVGYDHVTRYCRTMGWRNTNFVRPVMALELRAKGIENWTTPKEFSEIIEKIFRGSMISQEASREMIQFMTNPPIDDRLPRYLPPRIDIVHKTGLIYDNAHDVGIIYLPGDQAVLVSAFADNIGTNYMTAKETIASIARIIYEEATPPSLWEPGRRH